MDLHADPTPRVLLVDSGGVGTLGLREALAAEGIKIETNEAPLEDVLERLSPDEPHVVILDLDLDLDVEHAIAVAERIASEHPQVKVIICSLDEPRMQVFPAWGGRPYEAPLDPDRLVAAVRATE